MIGYDHTMASIMGGASSATGTSAACCLDMGLVFKVVYDYGCGSDRDRRQGGIGRRENQALDMMLGLGCLTPTWKSSESKPHLSCRWMWPLRRLDKSGSNRR